MRVLMLSKACLVGIYQRKLEEIARHPAVSDLKVLVPPSWKDERGEMRLERVYTQGYSLEVTPMRLNGYFHLHYYPAFGKTAHEYQPDIIHIDEEPYNLATWLALHTAGQIGAKTLFFSWQNINRNYPLPFRIGERWVLNTVDYALMGTQSAAEVWRAKGYRGKLAVVPQFGVDPDMFYPARDENCDTLRIGYIGRLVYEKGIDILLRALATLPGNWSLQIVGGGPEATILRHLAHQLNIQAKVHFAGQIPSVQMPEIYRNLDVLVVPSRTLPNWKEQFGRVIIEAMAGEVAVIGSDSGAIPDVIGDSGLLFRENDVEHLAAQIEHLLKNPELRRKLAQAGRQRILTHFTQKQVAEQTVAVYQDMMP